MFCRLNKYKEELDGCDWYASGYTKNCVTIDKNGTGLPQLWRQMLSQFPLCALETSEAIASVYKSPITLLQVICEKLMFYNLKYLLHIPMKAD